MKEGPNVAAVAALLGDPARSNMLTALMDGRALTATELAQEAGVTLQTTSGHLSRLEAAHLVTVEKQGRHRYFRLSGEDVAEVLEGLMGLAARTGHLRTQLGPKDPALRQARICYDHLAGDMGVWAFDRLRAKGFVAGDDRHIHVTEAGDRFFGGLGIDIDALKRDRRPLCRVCLDWSERRFHIAGAVGSHFLGTLFEKGWARRDKDSRVVRFTPKGRDSFSKLLA
ncbi:transcriptional regulator, ArsR family [Rhizobiales bacterium GAS188]|nr:transcriptional regulator, ArsR family [Rhizobiales bacterium GAS188]